MRALKIIVVVIIGLSVVVFGIGAFLSKDFRVERSIVVDAAPETVFDQVNTLRHWAAWSPWIAREPSMRNTYSGPASGVGATVTWRSESSGEGSQTITLSERPKRIETQLDFGQMGQPTADWSFERKDGGTKVTWGMSGEARGPLGGYFAATMDGILGPLFEEGLGRLKRVVEAEPQPNE